MSFELDDDFELPNKVRKPLTATKLINSISLPNRRRRILQRDKTPKTLGRTRDGL